MPVTINRKELLQAVTTAGKFADSRSVYSQICIDFKTRNSVRSFSCEGAFEQKIDRVHNEGECPSFEIDAAKMAKILNKSKSERVTLDMVEPSWLQIADDKGAVFHIVAHEKDDMPVMEAFETSTVTISAKKEHIDAILKFRAHVDDKRPHVQGICLSGQDKAILGTNGNILFAGKNDTIPNDMRVMIPRRAFINMPKEMAMSGDVSIRVSVFDGDEDDRKNFHPRYEMSNEAMTIYGYCAYGVFPDVSDLLLNDENFDSIFVDAEAMRYAVNQTFGVLDMVDYTGAILEFSDTMFKIGATNPNTGEFRPYEVPYKHEAPGINVETSFNPDYLMKAIAGTKAGDEVNIRVPRDCDTQVSIIYRDQTTVIMPMRI